MAHPVDLDEPYVMPADLHVVQRDATTVQIGTEHPRRMMLVDAPDETPEVLRRLNGGMTAGEAIAHSDGDPLVWRSLLDRLLDAGMLVPVAASRPVPPHLAGERLSLTHLHGSVVAERVLQARADALVVVQGAGPVSDAIAAVLASAGVGHVHHNDGDHNAGNGSRGVVADPLEAGRAPAGTDSPAARNRGAGCKQRAVGNPRPAGSFLAEVRTHRPAPQVPPSAVVLTGRRMPDLAQAAVLATSMIPHLAVWVTQARVVVGPLVLPGRTACLSCVDRHRTDRDPGWPAIAGAMRDHVVPPASLAVQASAELAASQVLDLLDGLRRPDAVDATIERTVGSLHTRLRRWPPHPDCGCRLLSGQL